MERTESVRYATGDYDIGITPEQHEAERAAARAALRRLHVPIVGPEGDRICEWCRESFPCADATVREGREGLTAAGGQEAG